MAFGMPLALAGVCALLFLVAVLTPLRVAGGLWLASPVLEILG
jgi:hypothetical protein